ncbi:sigma-70 family RNA polymerase sigma factor [Butyricicoccus sp.]|uniref:sigma-70 family RNA polymerase sigma factor n=1 Tax=Butyricicoccus sp. TaxID=2049021 RepID=UPI003F16AEBC
MLFSITTALLCGAAFCILRVSSPSGSFPRPLSAEQEAACIEAMQRGDKQAREKLIEHNLRLVAHIVKKYYSSTADSDDLISIGTIGLIKGVSTFDPGKNVRLATYISRCIENAILSQSSFCIHWPAIKNSPASPQPPAGEFPLYFKIM